MSYPSPYPSPYPSHMKRNIFPPVRSQSFSTNDSREFSVRSQSFSTNDSREFSVRSQSFSTNDSKFAEFDKYYNTNEQKILALISRVLNNDIRSADLEEHLNIFIDGLDRLQALYPVLSAVVTPFKTAMPMYFQKSENNEKITALQAQMLVTLYTLFRLRYITNPGEKGTEGITTETKMKALVELLAQDFTKATSFCELYANTDPLSRMMRYKTYEEHLAEQGELFAKRRRDILSMLNNIKIAQRDQDELRDLERKMNMTALLRRLENSNEQAVREFVDAKGGPEACLKDDELLSGVLKRSGQTTGAAIETSDLASLRQKLSQDFAEDLNQALNNKFDTLKSQLHEQESNIVSFLRSGAHDKIVNKDMKAIWQSMDWKGSVKARTFVLALHDYFNDKMSQSRSPYSGSPTTEASKDQWTLSYINVAHVQPILEAIDDDGTGFISIKEVNEFDASRPEGWTLLHWIAYWAAGWHVSIHQYRQKIYSLVQDIAKLAKDVHPENRKQVNKYLTHSTFTNLDLLLRSTMPVPAATLTDSKLIVFTNSYVAAEEERLKQGLESELDYALDNSMAISCVTGPGRIERFIYPLIFLVLKRHRKVVYLAQKHILNKAEFEEQTKTLSSLFGALKERTEGLTSIFKQSNPDVQARLGHFAFGILQSSYGVLKREPRNNILFTWNPQDAAGMTIELQEPLQSTSTSILKYNTRGPVDLYADSQTVETDHLCKCDGCGRDIIGSRLLCLTCMDENFSDNINLCSKCNEKSVSRDRFSHHISHSLLKVDDMILDGDLAWIIPEARSRANEIKDIFRSAHSSSDTGGTEDSQDAYSLLTCSSCKDTMNDSCWIALNFEQETKLCCDKCYSQGPSEIGDYLVRVRYVEDPLSVDLRLERLEQRIIELWAFTDGRVESSEIKVDGRLTSIESRLDSLEGKLDGCLTSLQGLLRQISGHGLVRVTSETVRMPLPKYF